MASQIRATARTSESRLRKLTPTCLLPWGAVLRRFSAEDVQTLRRRLSEPLECVTDPQFRTTAAQRRFGLERIQAAASKHHDVPIPARPADSRAKPLSSDEEVELFQRFNFLRYQQMQLLRKFAGQRLTLTAARLLLRLDHATRDVRDRIVEANLGLVPTMVQRARVSGADFSELISEGHMALLRSVDKFDCSRGFKFSTYACRAILTSITRAVASMARYRAVFPAEFDPKLQRGDMIDVRRAREDADSMTALREVLADDEADLSSTEREVLAERFGMSRLRPLDAPRDQKTLREVAQSFGVTKERVRQIQNRALSKLRDAIDSVAWGE